MSTKYYVTNVFKTKNMAFQEKKKRKLFHEFVLTPNERDNEKRLIIVLEKASLEIVKVF